MKLYLKLELKSDTCVAGAGGGRVGNVDTDLETDPASGLPIIRGRTLKGLLVEELVQLLRVLEPAGAGPWHDAAVGLFGARGQTRGGCLAFHDGALPADLSAAVAASHGRWHRAQVLDALTRVRSQTMIDPASGAPQPHSLRSTRLLRAGLNLHARLTSSIDLDARQRALVAACVAAVRRAGLHRNHGWGEVRLRLLDADDRDLTAAWLKGLRQPQWSSVTGAESEPSPAVASASVPTGAHGRRVLTYRLRLAAPVVLAEAGADSSSVETLPYLGGATVLGALAWRWLDRNAPGDDPAGHADFRRLFLDGSARFLNAYVAGSDRSRLLPCPLSLARRKGDGAEPHPAYDRAQPGFDAQRRREPDTQWTPLETPLFVRFKEPAPPDDEEEDYEHTDNTEPRLYGRAPSRRPRLHQARDDREAGRSTEGALFSYVALDASEVLCGHILCEHAADAATIKALLEAGPLPLGRARNAGYGGWAEIEALEEHAAEPWREAPIRRRSPHEPSDRLVVTLLSDYLGVNAQGQADPAALEDEMRAALGVDNQAQSRFLRGRSVAGYVSHWRMRRPTQPAVAAGSLLVFNGTRPDPARVAELCWQGLGQRRAEGFGRVAVDWHGGLALQAQKDSAPDSIAAAAAGDDADSAALTMLKRHLLYDTLWHTLTHLGNRDAKRVAHPPSPALIGRLRGRIRTASSAAEVRAFLRDAAQRADDKGLKQAGRALLQARLAGQSLDDWLVDQLSGTQADPQPGWLQHPEVRDACEGLGLDLELLSAGERWRLLQGCLDAFCEHLRRRAQAHGGAATAGE